MPYVFVMFVWAAPISAYYFDWDKGYLFKKYILCINPSQNNKNFKIILSYSMPMYLFHQQIIYLSIVTLNGKVNPWINTDINFIVAFIGSFSISTIFMRWKGIRFLIGEK